MDVPLFQSSNLVSDMIVTVMMMMIIPENIQMTGKVQYKDR
jgi:hypothetical protein